MLHSGERRDLHLHLGDRRRLQRAIRGHLGLGSQQLLWKLGLFGLSHPHIIGTNWGQHFALLWSQVFINLNVNKTTTSTKHSYSI